MVKKYYCHSLKKTGLSTCCAVCLMRKNIYPAGISGPSRNTIRPVPDFKKRIDWFENYRAKNNRYWPNEERGDGEEILLSLVKKDRLIHLLRRMLNEEEYLSCGDIRALSKYHQASP